MLPLCSVWVSSHPVFPFFLMMWSLPIVRSNSQLFSVRSFSVGFIQVFVDLVNYLSFQYILSSALISLYSLMYISEGRKTIFPGFVSVSLKQAQVSSCQSRVFWTIFHFLLPYRWHEALTATWFWWSWVLKCDHMGCDYSM